MALFQYWNFNRFNNPFSIYRENIMQLSKLSKNTYHKCVKELHEAKYIYYHPSPSKFQAVRISIVRLDKEEEPKTRYHQLDLFDGIKNETGRVANLRPASTNTKTDTVSNLGHIIKPNSKTERNTPSPDFLEEDEILKKKTVPASVSNLGHDTERSRSAVQPTLSEVEEWFTSHAYPHSEATKFFNHYKSLGWKIQGKTPIEDWKPLVEKWMTNAKKWENTTEPKSVSPQSNEKTKEVQYLYDCFLENKNIFHQITEQHFDQLQLQLNDQIMQLARHQRLNQVAGTNQYSLNQLWQAYLKGNSEDPLLIKDRPNLILLAKRIAVLQHFHQQKTNNHEH
ncbi:MAG: hypothetical protein GXC73_15525 [Chitinophagaceae bacterium]|nr:hypothetical protein [Chitinophagaceae bacterium]